MDSQERRELFHTRRLLAVRKGSTWVHYKRHHDDEFFDRIEFEIVPRYKMSDLSGDEWRVSAVARYISKGVVVIERSYSTLQYAITHAPWMMRTAFEDDGYDREKFEKLLDDLHAGKLCLQPGCSAPATKVYRLLAEYSREGFKYDGYEDRQILRAFCDDHAERGDCGLEDADTNYVVQTTKAAEPATEPVSPFGNPKTIR